MIALYKLLLLTPGIKQKRDAQLMLLMHTKMSIHVLKIFNLWKKMLTKNPLLFSNKRCEWQINLKLSLIFPELLRNKFIETMYQLIYLNCTIKELLSYQLLTHSFLKWHIILISSVIKQLNYWFWHYHFYVLKSLKKMLTFPHFWKRKKEIW